MMTGVAHQKIFLIDTFGFIFRAYHARARSGAPPMRTASGLSTEAVFIFNSMLRKVLKKFDPQYVAAVFESEEPTLRSLEFAEYKANRPETPPDLIEQIPQVRRLLDAMRAAPKRTAARWSSFPATRTCCSSSPAASPC
jgi:DNA polymerase-1